MCNRCSTDRKNFFITTDSDGNMPRLERGRVPSRPFYIQYRDDRPVVVAPYFDQDKVWDYSRSEFLSLRTGAKRYDGTTMPVYQGRIVDEYFA
jgi:hypothetical protein